MKNFKYLAVLIIMAFFTSIGCDNNPDNNPVINQGPTATIIPIGSIILKPNLSIFLEGIGHDPSGNTLIYNWTQKMDDAVLVTVSNSDKAKAIVTEIKKSGDYIFEFTVTDLNGKSDTKTITITVNPATVVVNYASFSLLGSITYTGQQNSINLTPIIDNDWKDFISFTLIETDEITGLRTYIYNYNNSIVSIPNTFAGHTDTNWPRITQTFYYDGDEIGSIHINLRSIRDTRYGYYFTSYSIISENLHNITSFPKMAPPNEHIAYFEPITIIINELE